MIKNALHIYRKNIWNVFALIGFVSLGIFIALFVVIPALNNSLNITINKVISTATTYKFSKNDFLIAFNEKFSKLDWANPVKTLKELFENNLLHNILVYALEKGGLNQVQITNVMKTISTDLKTFANVTINQIYVLVAIIGVVSIIGYISTKIVIQINSTNDRNIIRFIASFVLNILALVLVYVLLLLAILSVSGAALFFSAVGIFILMLICMLIISVLCYKKKGIRIFEILNLKNVLYLFLSSLIIFSISFVIFVIVYIFSDIIALLISIPLLLITTIVVENIVVSDVTTNLYKKLDTSKN